MGALIFNTAKGRLARYCDLPSANDNLVWVLFKSSGLVSDATFLDYATLAAVKAGNTEAAFTGYARLAQATATVTTDNSTDTVTVDITTDPFWSPTSAEGEGAIVLCYNPDTTANGSLGVGFDANLVPLFKDDFNLTTPTSGTVTYQIATGGFYTAS